MKKIKFKEMQALRMQKQACLVYGCKFNHQLTAEK